MQNDDATLLLRSVLYVPAIKEKALLKVAQLSCDAIIIDLEDSVSPQEKKAARECAWKFANASSLGVPYRILRVNGLYTPDIQDDYDMMQNYPCDAILVPKINDKADIDALCKLSNKAVFLMVETPQMIVNLQPLLDYALHKKLPLKGLVVGTNDLSKDTEIPFVSGRANMLYALQKIALCAKAYKLVVIDGVYADFRDNEGCKQEAEQGYLMGYNGKTVIHPQQIPIVNTVFLPDAQQVAMAQDIINAFSLPENIHKNVISIHGKMVEKLHYEMAQKTIEKVTLAKSRNGLS